MKITGIIAITGGSGASTTATYVARILASMKKKVLLVDLNPINESARLLLPVSIVDFSNIKNNVIDFQQYICHSQFSHIDILTNYGNNLQQFNFLDNFIAHNDFFAQLQDFVKEKYDHVLFDYNASYSHSVQNCLQICNQVIGVICPQTNGINKTISFLKMFTQARVGNPLHFIKILINNIDNSKLVHRIMLQHYNAILSKELKLPLAIPQFKVYKEENRIRQQLPINTYKSLATIIN